MASFKRVKYSLSTPNSALDSQQFLSVRMAFTFYSLYAQATHSRLSRTQISAQVYLFINWEKIKCCLCREWGYSIPHTQSGCIYTHENPRPLLSLTNTHHRCYFLRVLLGNAGGISWERLTNYCCAPLATPQRISTERNFSENVLKNKTFNCGRLFFTCVNTLKNFADANFCKYSFMLAHRKESGLSRYILMMSTNSSVGSCVILNVICAHYVKLKRLSLLKASAARQHDSTQLIRNALRYGRFIQYIYRQGALTLAAHSV